MSNASIDSCQNSITFDLFQISNSIFHLIKKCKNGFFIFRKRETEVNQTMRSNEWQYLNASKIKDAKFALWKTPLCGHLRFFFFNYHTIFIYIAQFLFNYIKTQMGISQWNTSSRSGVLMLMLCNAIHGCYSNFTLMPARDPLSNKTLYTVILLGLIISVVYTHTFDWCLARFLHIL